jgi:hypothetical protein
MTESHELIYIENFFKNFSDDDKKVFENFLNEHDLYKFYLDTIYKNKDSLGTQKFIYSLNTLYNVFIEDISIMKESVLNNFIMINERLDEINCCIRIRYDTIKFFNCPISAGHIVACYAINILDSLGEDFIERKFIVKNLQCVLKIVILGFGEENFDINFFVYCDKINKEIDINKYVDMFFEPIKM